MVKTLANFNIDYHQYLKPDQDSIIDNSTLEVDITNEQLKEFYKTMVSTRLFDAKAVSLQRTGQMGTYPSGLGQEAIGTAIGNAMQPEDVFVTYYRDCAAQLLRGVTMTEILLYWGGSEQGNNYQSPIARQDLPHCVPMASQCLHAAGVATAMKIRGEKRAVVVTCGDGATSEGDFYETINVAGIWNLPLVVVIINNQWAISVPRNKQCAALTLAQKAIAAGIPGEQVDGNDIIGYIQDYQ
jgi:2-oxoisovalerate dehydrogenase E1 component alpha subunit